MWVELFLAPPTYSSGVFMYYGKYKCTNCECIFKEKEMGRVHISYEDYYGVGHLFPNRTPHTIYVCPNCGSEDYDEYHEDEEEEYEEDEEL